MYNGEGRVMAWLLFKEFSAKREAFDSVTMGSGPGIKSGTVVRVGKFE